jgi:phage terminase small subunit
MAQGSKITPLRPEKQPKTGPKAPGHLKTAGKRLWLHVAENFELEQHDFLLLTSLAETLDRKNQAEKDLKAHGSLTFKNRYDELKPHPCVAIVRDCNVTLARLRRELCLSENEPEDRRPPRMRYGGK